MAEYGRVHPKCVNAANPYHECAVECFEKIAEGKGRKDKKKLDYHNGIKEGELTKKMDGERRVHSTCTKASNPYHNCDEFCTERNAGAGTHGFKKETGSFVLEASRSFGRKKKGSDSQAKTSRVPKTVSATKVASPVDAPSHFPKKIVEQENGGSFSSEQNFEESDSQDHSFDEGQVLSYHTVPKSGNLMPDHLQTPSNGIFTCFAIATPTRQETDENVHASPEVLSKPIIKDLGEVTTGPVNGSMNFSFSGISRASEDSDEYEVQSVISDSCVSVGKYHVKASVAPILQLILEKYGDIAANCHLESVSMRAYYLECLCSVVQELHSTPFTQLTKAKVKEMLAVLKDVESSKIDVGWLRGILHEIMESMDHISQHQAIQAAKTNCDHVMNSTRKELEAMMQDLAVKEEEVTDAKARISETRARLRELELESSQLSESVLSIGSKVEKLHSKSLVDELVQIVMQPQSNKLQA